MSNNSGCGTPSCEPQPIIPQFDATQIFYHKECDAENSNLTTLGLNNGISLELFMESVDAALNESNAFNFTAVALDCLKERYTINNMSNFVNAMNSESCRLNSVYQSIADQNTAIGNLANSYNTILSPGFTSGNCNLGFTPSTALIPAIQGFINHYCSFISTLQIPVSPAILGINNSTIQWSNHGLLNHNLVANVRISNDDDNVIEARADGLYATIPGVGPVWQTLAWNAGTSKLSISNGNEVIINFPGAQVLGLTGNIVSLTGGGGSIDLTSIIAPAFTETVLAVTTVNAALSFTQSGTSQHTLALKIEKDAVTGSNNNILQITASGLYVPPSTVSNGLTAASATAFKLGGALTENTELTLSTYFLYLKADADKTSLKYSNTNGFELFQHGSSLIGNQIKIESDVLRFKSKQTSSHIDYLKVDSWDGSAYKIPKLWIGVADSNDDAGNGSRNNFESSIGFRYHLSTAATYALTENHVMYLYKGQTVAANQNLTLPNPTTSVGFGSNSTAWVFCIKNFSSDPADIITTNYGIYTDESTNSTNIAPGTSMVIAAIDGKWVKIN